MAGAIGGIMGGSTAILLGRRTDGLELELALAGSGPHTSGVLHLTYQPA